MNTGDRVQVRPDLDHWSAGTFGTVVNDGNSKYPVGVLLDDECETAPIGYRVSELVKA